MTNCRVVHLYCNNRHLPYAKIYVPVQVILENVFYRCWSLNIVYEKKNFKHGTITEALTLI